MATSLAKAGSYSEAITIAREVVASHPDAVVAYRYLAAWASMNDDLETARWAANKLLAAQPDFTIQQYLALPFFRHMKRWTDQIADALKRIGLPER